jgi:hypothetical protein
VGDVLVLETRWAQQYDQDGNSTGPKVKDQAAADASRATSPSASTGR